MSVALTSALIFTVAWLVTTAYFFLGALPLLVLKHDTPMDSLFVQGFFNTYYLAAMFIASATAVSYACAGRWVVAAGAATLAALAFGMRREVIPKMRVLRTRLQDDAAGTVSAFRRIHLTAVVVSLVQLVLVVWSLVAASLQARTGG